MPIKSSKEKELLNKFNTYPKSALPKVLTPKEKIEAFSLVREIYTYLCNTDKILMIRSTKDSKKMALRITYIDILKFFVCKYKPYRVQILLCLQLAVLRKRILQDAPKS